MATKTKKDADLESALETGVDESEARVYELGFHLDPELPQEEVKKAYQEIRGAIAAAGTIIAEGEPTKIPLAYMISRSDTSGRRDFTSAFFCWIAYEAQGTGHEAVATMARDDKRIIRFLDIRTDVDAAKHAAEMHELFVKNAQNQERADDFEDEVAEIVDGAEGADAPETIVDEVSAEVK